MRGLGAMQKFLSITFDICQAAADKCEPASIYYFVKMFRKTSKCAEFKFKKEL